MSVVDWAVPTEARLKVDKGLDVVDGLMTYASDKRGRRAKKEIALYMASVTFAYAVWENFVEELAVELVEKLAELLEPDQISRPQVREFIEKDATPWELAVHPGWRMLWVDRVKKLAVGEEDGGWGLNTANSRNTRRLFESVGINPFPDTYTDRLDALVALRGEIVHTAATKQPIYKAEVRQHTDLVRALSTEVDEEARKQCQNWLAAS